MNELTKNNRIIVWRGDGFKLELYDLNRRDEYGKWILGYRFFDSKELIFTGDGFHNSPMQAIDSIETVYSLLGFLSLREGDTDSEYFEHYTPRQLEWSNSDRCELLSFYVYDWEERRYHRN